MRSALFVVILACIQLLGVQAEAENPAGLVGALDRLPTSEDGPPAYRQDMLWLDPQGRTWMMRELGHGHAVWLALDPVPPVIDAIGGVAPAAAYGTMRLTVRYSGPALSVENVATKATASIGFLADGRLDQAALAAFCEGSECRLVRWFDQSGQQRDAVQPDLGAAPVVRVSHRVGQGLAVVWDYEATSGGSQRWMALPDKLAINSGNASLLWTGRFHNASLISPVIELGTDANALNFGFWDAHGDFYLGTRDHLNEIPGHAALTASIGVISSSQTDGLVVDMRNRVTLRGKLPLEAHRGGLIGRTIAYKQSGMMELAALMIYDRPLTPLERLKGKQALGEEFRVAQQQEAIYVADGDSLTQGIATPYGQSYPWSMERLLPRDVLLYDAGWGGKTIGGAGGLLARFPDFTAKLLDPTARHNVISLFAGTNDIQAGADAKTVVQLITQYAAAARAAGFKIVVASILPRGTFNPAMEAHRNAVNAALRAHWREFADGFADLAGNTVFVDPKAAGADWVYVDDGIHLTEAGAQLVATEMAAVVRPLLGE